MVNDAEIGSRLQAARRSLDLTQTEVGTRMRMVASTVSAIEAGKRPVTGTELYQFAELYKRPLAFFYGEQVPASSSGFQYLFRQVDERILDRESIVNLENLAGDYRLLEELVGTDPLPIPPDYAGFGFRGVEDAEILADMERSRLGLGDAPIKNLADTLDEGAGARAFALPVANQSWSGLVVKDDTGRPCIAVNIRDEPYRRNYDLAHEYGHVLVHLGRDDRPQARVDLNTSSEGRASPDERFVDAFAAAFLMPKRGVLDQLDRVMRASRGRFTDYDLVHMAMHFGVSGPAMSLRLVALRKLSRTAHEALWKMTDPRFKARAELLGYTFEEPPSWDRPWLPSRYRLLAWKAYDMEIISVSKLAEFLREDVFELRAMVQSSDLQSTTA
jgi:Zn-dependent peptidase ImmA (M78 family)/transcriptional regulator with XRE-family HTH domain